MASIASTRVCPDCGERLYGAAGISQRPARVTWICRKAGCGYVDGNVPVLAPRCPCGAVVPPGTGREFQAADSPITLCDACTELHPDGAPREILDQHRRAERAQQQAEQYDFAPATERHHPVVRVTQRETGAVYTVRLFQEPYTCTCPDYQDRCAGSALQCKHVLMVLHWLRERTPDPTETQAADAELLAALAQIERQRLHAQAALDQRVNEAIEAAQEACRQRAADHQHQLEAERLAAIRAEHQILWPED